MEFEDRNGILVPSQYAIPEKVEFEDRNGILVPSQYAIPEKVGFGCPKCDKCEVVPFSKDIAPELLQKVVQDFLAIHAAHTAVIHCIEVRDKVVYVTGELHPEKPPKAVDA